MKKRLLQALLILALIIPCGEIAARILGWGPQRNENYHVRAVPDNWMIGDEKYGIALNPGTFKVTLNDALKFTVSHTADSLRLVPGQSKSLHEVMVLGCSFTYGYGVDDSRPFTSLLQKKFDSLRFHNYGVPGHGTVQALIRLNQELANGNIPKYVVVVYSAWHLDRNVLSARYRRNLRIGYRRSNKNVNEVMTPARFPKMIEGKISWINWNDLYQNWPLRSHSAFVNALQTSWEGQPSQSDKAKMIQVTNNIFDEIVKCCHTNNVKLIVVNLDDHRFDVRYGETLKNCGIVHVNFDFSNHDLTNYPYDEHPNASGHQFIAKKIESYLKSLVDE